MLKRILEYLTGFLLVLMFLALFLTNQLLDVDINLFLLINGVQSSILDSLFTTITFFGSTTFLVILIFILWIGKKRRLATYLIVSLFVDSILSIGFKLTFMRPRPYESFSNIKVLDREFGPSMPSGHSQRAFSEATIFSNNFKGKGVVFYVFAFFISFSRIYVGAHYPLDAIVGSVLGLITGNIIVRLPINELQIKLEYYWNKIFSQI